MNGGIHVRAANGIGRIILANPPLNILTRSTLAALQQAVDRLVATQDLRVILLLAEGRHFSAGADVGEHLPPEYETMIPEFVRTVALLAEGPLPVIAAVRGKCLGGGFELVQAADLVIAGESAVFGHPEIALGVFPPAACALLPERCGHAVAASLILTGDPIRAPEAQEAGLVYRVVPDDDAEASAEELAGRIARYSAATVRLARRALLAGGSGRRAASLRSAQEIYVETLMATADAVEGLEAFQEKRVPAWSHR
jgi:cyclohexa-1,5-dienecarbonyl-CoA hydratase